MATSICDYDLSELKNNEMKEFSFNGDAKILIIKQNEQIFAVSNKCTHYGAQLVNGVLNNGKIRCPWHGACFNIKNGDIEDFPGLDNLTSFQVDKIGDNKFRISKTEHSTNKKFNEAEVVIIGGGPSGLECAEKLRNQGFDGKLTIITKDKHIPYDRPKLSKAMDVSIESILLRQKDFLDKLSINFITTTTVVGIDFNKKFVCMESSQNLKYDKLFIATGASPFIPDIPGHNLTNVFSLRTFNDAKKIFDQITPAANLVIVGSSFIGMEVASYLVSKVARLTVVDRVNVPFENTFGSEVGSFLKELHVQNGVNFKFRVQVTEFTGDAHENVKEVVLSNGERLLCDVCIMGIGVRPETSFINKSPGSEKLIIDSAGFIQVNLHMETGIPDVYAGGDIVKFPLFLSDDNQPANIQHWQMAHKHGQIAALNMFSNHKTPIKSVPYFWTVHYGKSLRYVGYNQGFQEILMHCDEKKTKFVVYYIKSGHVKAVLTFMRDPVASIIAEILLSERKLTKSEIIALQSSFEKDSYIQGLKDILASIPAHHMNNNNNLTTDTYTYM